MPSSSTGHADVRVRARVLHVALLLVFMTFSPRSSAEPSATFDDADSLPVPVVELVTREVDSWASFGLRGSVNTLPFYPHRSAPNLGVELAVSWSLWSSAHRPLYWGRHDSFRLNAALGAGYLIDALYDVGAFVTSNSQGDGGFLQIGADFGARSIGKAPFRRAFAEVPVGYAFKLAGSRSDIAVLPSFGGISAKSASVDVHLEPWLRQRARAHFWRILLEAEHGQALRASTEHYFEASLCASPGRWFFVACSSLLAVERRSAPRASVTEVAVSLGFGAMSSGAEPRTR